MQSITYCGPHEAVIIPLASGISYECDREGSVDLPNELAKELLAREDWRPSKSTKTIKQPEKGKE